MAKLIGIKHHADIYMFYTEDLLQASAEILGTGTFGVAYKAEIGFCTVTVKRLSNVVISEKEFKDRVESLGAMKHPSIMRPLAYYYSNDEKLLIYEYMPRGSLSFFLHENGGTSLDWDTRARITLGVARGISYIHSTGEDVSHGNIKSSNILLDEFRNAYVSDCGLTYLVHQTAESSAGGYVASQKDDVYNFGIVLLELLTCKKPIQSFFEEGWDLPRWVQYVDRDKWSSEVLDVELRSENMEGQMVQMLQLGLRCTKQNPVKRPSLREVVAKIEEVCRTRLQQWDQVFN